MKCPKCGSEHISDLAIGEFNQNLYGCQTCYHQWGNAKEDLLAMDARNLAVKLFKSSKGAAEVLAALMEQDDIENPRVIVAAAMDEIGYLEE